MLNKFIDIYSCMVDIIEIFENTPGWMKWTGGSFIIVFLLLLFIASQPGGDEVVRVPSTIAEVRENATEAVIGAGVQASKESSNTIMSSFHQAGESMAQQVKDPVTKGTIIAGMSFAGFLLSLVVALSIMGAILGALGVDVSWLKN